MTSLSPVMLSPLCVATTFKRSRLSSFSTFNLISSLMKPPRGILYSIRPSSGTVTSISGSSSNQPSPSFSFRAGNHNGGIRSFSSKSVESVDLLLYKKFFRKATRELEKAESRGKIC